MRSIFARIVVCALVTAFVAACALPGPQPAADVTVTDSKNAVITAEQRGNVLILDVQSATGIGEATVALPAGESPRDLILRMHLSGLENLTFAYTAGTVRLYVQSHGEPIVREEFVPVGQSDAQPIARGSPYWMNVGILSNNPAATPGIPLKEGHFDVSAPRDFLEGGNADFTFSWIDFYR